MKKINLKVIFLITIMIGLGANLFADDSAFIRLNTYVEENVNNTGIRLSTTDLVAGYTYENFDDLFFTSQNEISFDSEDVSIEGREGFFNVLTRRVVNQNITVTVLGSEMALIGDPNATIEYKLFDTGDPNAKIDTQNNVFSFTYTGAPVGGIVRSYKNYRFYIPKATNAAAGGYSAKITFEITTE